MKGRHRGEIGRVHTYMPPRSQTWWIRYTINGVQHHRNTGHTDEAQALVFAANTARPVGLGPTLRKRRYLRRTSQSCDRWEMLRSCFPGNGPRLLEIRHGGLQRLETERSHISRLKEPQLFRGGFSRVISHSKIGNPVSSGFP